MIQNNMERDGTLYPEIFYYSRDVLCKGRLDEPSFKAGRVRRAGAMGVHPREGGMESMENLPLVHPQYFQRGHFEEVFR